MDVEEALAFARTQQRGVLATIRRDGRPQMSNVSFAVLDRHRVRVSVTDSRAKTQNMRRDPRAALHVNAPDYRQYVVLDGTVELSAVAHSPNDDAVDALVEYYRVAAGEHEDWDDFRRVMVEEGRIAATITVTSAYGMLLG
jgi:PPOX class probable F420-dependent enzyme